jgi:hypothetical protein
MSYKILTLAVVLTVLLSVIVAASVEDADAKPGNKGKNGANGKNGNGANGSNGSNGGNGVGGNGENGGNANGGHGCGTRCSWWWRRTKPLNLFNYQMKNGGN